ncbi:MAG: translation initiation factor IF-3 [Nitrospirae bacterium]|nr:translation initiation factor IF-3 [Nitrospirota bacterium]MBF0518381.1 translation initiation factor IF-3 [Nitrospirota bacterium]MBF0534291.1 translation initiation factor IF-3 [Nitrospirota bacterium]MBF0615728.1 translation initiation factor IF-3 [Nitrospirota bacterium]
MNNKVKVNEQIKSPQIRLIDVEGGQLGIVAVRDAIRSAKEKGLDLVEVAPGANPPVCRIMDFGKYKYQISKKHSHRKTTDVKEVKIRPRISDHDLERKVNQMIGFLGEGDKAKVSMYFRGREIIRPEHGMAIFDNIVEKLQGNYNIEVKPKLDGKSIIMVVAPK